MGAACTRIDVSPEVVRAINTTQYIRDASFETLWKSITPRIHIYSYDKQMNIQRLLSSYLKTNPVKDHYLSIRIDDYIWHFEIQTNRRLSRVATEIVLTSQPHKIDHL